MNWERGIKRILTAISGLWIVIGASIAATYWIDQWHVIRPAEDRLHVAELRPIPKPKLAEVRDNVDNVVYNFWQRRHEEKKLFMLGTHDVIIDGDAGAWFLADEIDPHAERFAQMRAVPIEPLTLDDVTGRLIEDEKARFVAAFGDQFDTEGNVKRRSYWNADRVSEMLWKASLIFLPVIGMWIMFYLVRWCAAGFKHGT